LLQKKMITRAAAVSQVSYPVEQRSHLSSLEGGPIWKPHEGEKSSQKEALESEGRRSYER